MIVWTDTEQDTEPDNPARGALVGLAMSLAFYAAVFLWWWLS